MLEFPPVLWSIRVIVIIIVLKYVIYICIYIREPIIGFQDVVFLSSRASYSTTFLKNCGRGESLGTTTCLKTVVTGSMPLPAPCKILLLQQSLFVSIEFHGLSQSLA